MGVFKVLHDKSIVKLKNESSIEHGGTSTLYNFMEKFFGTKRLHKRI